MTTEKTITEEIYQENPQGFEYAKVASNASECICSIMRAENWSRKQLRKAVGWTKKKLNKVLDNDEITLKRLVKLLFVMGYRVDLTAVTIPANLQEIVKQETQPDPIIEND